MSLHGSTSDATAETTDWSLAGVRTAGAFCLILGATVLLGWQFDIDRLKSLLPGLTQMKSNSALGIALLGLALSLHGWRANHPRSRGAARALAALVSLMALATLLEYATGLNLRLDELLYADTAPGVLHPGRMAPNTAVCFLLLGSAVLLNVDRAGWRARGSQLLAVLAALIALTTLFGYLRLKGQVAGLYGTEFGLALFALSQLATLSFVAWWAGNLLYRVDTRRRAAEAGQRSLLAELEATNVRLEQTVAERTLALTVSEGHLRLVLENAPTLIGYVDTELRYRFCNRTYQEWYGDDPATLIGHRIPDQIGEVAFTQVRCHYDRALSGQRDRYERRLEHGQTPRDILVELVPDVRQDGQVAGIFIGASDITARRRDEQALRESEARFHSAFDFAAIGMALVSREGRWLQVNRALCDIVGYTEQELLGLTFQQITHPDDLASDLEFVRRLLAGEIDTYQMEKRYLHKQGHIVWVLLSVSLVRDKDQGPVNFISQIQDIALRKKAELALAQTEARVRMITDTSPACIGYVDTELRFEFCNRTFEDWYGAARETFIGQRVRDVIGETAYAEVEPYYRQVMAGERVNYGRTLVRDGSAREVLVDLIPHVGEDGSVVGAYISAADITARVRGERALRDSEERFQLVVRGSDDGIWDWNIAAGYCYFSPRYKELLGYAEQEFEPVRASFEACLHPDDREQTAARMRAHFAAQVPYEVEYRLRTKSGEYRWFHARGQATWDAEGKPVRFTGALRDITQHREADERFRKTADLLRQTERMAKIGGWELNIADSSAVWSEEVYRIHELDPAARLDLSSAIHFFAPEARPAIDQAVQRCIEQGTPWDLELPFITATGRRRWVRTVGSAVTRDGKTVRLYGTFQDITERKNAELALERSRQFLDAVIEGIPQPVFVKDLQHRWVLFNSGYCDMMERGRAELLGKSDPDIHSPQLVQRYWAEDNEAFSMDQPLFVEMSVTRSDGSVRWLLKSKRRVDLADGAYVVGIATDITRQKETEMALRESEERFRGLTQLSADWFWEQDEQLRFTSQTGGGLASMQIMPDLGKTRWELPFVGMSETDWARHKAMLEARESFHNLELCRPNNVGELRYISLSGEPVFDAAGNFKGYRGVGRDITAPKRIEEALRKSEESHRLLAENSSDMITRLTPEAYIEYASPASTVVIGFSPEQLTGRSVGEFIHPDDLAQARALFVDVVKHDMVNVVTCRLRHQDKGWLWMETSFRSVREPGSGWTTQVIGVSRNVDERVRVTEALNRFQYVLDHTRDMIFIADTESLRFSYINLGAAETLGYPREQLLGMAPWEIRTGSTEAEYRKVIEPLLRGDIQSHQYEAVHRRADGTEFPVDATLQIVRRLGEADLFVWLIRDATERKKIDRMKNEFVSTVSHELRTPLTSILGSLGLIIGGAVGELPEQAKDLVRIAHNNSERLVRLINDILDIEKIESGKMRFEFRPYRVRPLLEQALEANRGYGEQLGVRFEVQGEIPDSVVRLDSDRFMQVMSNLLSNAAKFSPSPGIVEVAATRVEGTVRICVTDHGPGIPEDFRSKIFGKFCQADSSDSRQKGGTGLGLSIAKAIVEKHGGHIGFDTQIGVGTTFHVSFREAADVPAHWSAAPFGQPALDNPDPLREDATAARLTIPSPIEPHMPHPQPMEVVGEITGEHNDLSRR
jgi:PAS domain S-box-containing protein